MEGSPGSLQPQPPDAGASRDDRASGRVRLVHALGMHARPAVKLTRLAKQFGCRIAVRVEGAANWIDAKSVSRVMAMRAPFDSVIEFLATGEGARAAVAALTGLVAQDFPDTDG